ncbi:IS110 family transposase [uncultured Cellulomonas sp.]|uniref:IS110 family transposase n=1 Tax=uncultured Cellulomonas sp. TaxID=189682 RepID=UPI0028EDF3AD|nr:IS110 family transposase [uncultured Cellulomonas sp.]
MFMGIDTHKDTLAVAVCDGRGQLVEWLEVVNDNRGFVRLTALLARRPVVRVGIEGSGHFGRAVAAHLSTAGVDVREVPTTMTSRERGARPGQGKTDEVDALAIARITARDPGLPEVRLKVGVAADLRALLDYREDLIVEHYSLANQVHSELVGLIPGYHLTHPHLKTTAQVNAMLTLIGDDERIRSGLTRRRLVRVLALIAETRAVTTQIAALVAGHADAVNAIYGVGPVVAARFLAEIVDIHRYPNRDTFASANGTAPLPASSGRTVRHRLNRGGNRQLNRALYTIALTQIRADTEGRTYYDRKRAEGKTSREAIRCLKRRLSDQVFKAMRVDAAVEMRSADAA